MTQPHPQPSSHYLDLLLDVVFLVDTEGRVAYVNAACESVLGYSQHELMGRSMLDFVAPEDHERTRIEGQKVLSGESRAGFENTYLHKSGRRVRLMWTARWSEADQMRVGVARDVTQRRQLEAFQAVTFALFEATSKLNDIASLFQQVHSALNSVVPVETFAVITVSESHPGRAGHLVFNCFGAGPWLPAAQAAQARHKCQAVYDTALNGNALQASVQDGWCVAPLMVHNRLLGAVALQADFTALNFDAGMAFWPYFFGQLSLAVERLQWQARLVRQASHDELTGLPNRRALNERLADVVSRCQRHGGRMALLFIDLDDFKQINDVYGHDSGDMLLRAFAHRLKHGLRLEDAAYRFGGDEFIVLLDDAVSQDIIQTVTAKITHIASLPVETGAATLQVSASVGVALFPDHGADAESLIAYADQIMYARKRSRSVGTPSYAGGASC
ncbi:GGDEF domain-containing protein [Pusillimonas sp. NJUB218]|uniref:GGDEF domain-containing protein n=1 Tax=Pusillimonas sp. NJUB218 TaxID=2023230 RepID=UPI000F4B4C85|nr:GGDEF domain-containing protein [Pusillimonas sp. NJUB218]ROT44576.1 hypothetical protein CHR62_11100 [Pusillimonas sp. NJUB218]